MTLSEMISIASQRDAQFPGAGYRVTICLNQALLGLCNAGPYMAIKFNCATPIIASSFGFSHKLHYRHQNILWHIGQGPIVGTMYTVILRPPVRCSSDLGSEQHPCVT